MSEEKQDASETTEETKVEDATPAEQTAPAEPQKETKEEAPAETPAEEPAAEETKEEASSEPAAEVSQEEITGKPEETKEEPEEEVVVEEVPYQDIKPGMVVRVHERILDVSPKGEKRERIQIFEGLVIGMKGGGVSRTMTVRKDSKGWMVEKIYPLSSPNVTNVEVVKQYRVRRAKLNYLRGRFKRKLREIKKD